MSSRLPCKRQLAGFGPLLDWRPLDFVDTVPNVFCCTLCGVMPAFPKRLTPCCHVFCQPCFDSLVQRERCCPLDQTPFAYDAVETLDSVRGGIYQLRALCPNSCSGCTLVAFLPELKGARGRSMRLYPSAVPALRDCCLQKAALNHYLNDCAGAQRKVASPVWSDTSSLESDEVDSRCSDHKTPWSVKALDKAKSPGGSPVGIHESRSVTATTAESNPKTVSAIRALLHESHGGSIRSASHHESRVPSMESSLIKTGRKGGSSSKFNLPKRVTAKALKNALGVPGDDKALSERQLLDWVDLLLAKVGEILPSEDDVAAAVAAEEAETSNPSSSGSGSGSNKPASSFASSRRRSRKRDSKRSRSSVRVVTASSPGFACCYIMGVVDAESRIACGEELVLRSDSSQMADCTFRVHARLRRDADGSALVSFTLCLCGGTWRQVADWALANKVSLLLVHPWDQAQNRRMPLCLNPESVPLPTESVPDPRRWDFWSPTSELKLKELSAGGFVSSGAICIALEIE
ncbi:hypothetical protein HPB51_028728 [Rhipicephalus microplus]|uniref:RING-type domain-containing protein n=1 Tax=Rhipicephalus microplus TaxID=6941 RepID=A0A9J6CW80_RHIMP|nr:hypothetical protein HPB51_028728 [Rhipicephalus microplus]